MTVPPPGFQKGRVTYVQNGANFARRRVARAQVRASEALRLLGRAGEGYLVELRQNDQFPEPSTVFVFKLVFTLREPRDM